MKKNPFFLLVFLTFCQLAFSQIDPEESSAQIIGYWDLNEQQSYLGTYSKYRIREQDTSYILKCNYRVDVSIKDSTDTSYTIQWHYRDYQVETDNELLKKLTGISGDMKVLFRTDELGAFQEVLNWEEIRDHTQKAKPILQKEFAGTPNLEQIITQAFLPYSTKEGIENNALMDIQLFHHFHGGKYILNETYEANLFTPNNYDPEAPFDTKLEVSLDELNLEDGNCVIRSYQQVDSDQLTQATAKYLNVLAGAQGQQLLASEIPTVSNETFVASRIHGNTGWVIYSLFSKEVSAEDMTNVEEITLEIDL